VINPHKATSCEIIPGIKDNLENEANGGVANSSIGLTTVIGILKIGPRHGASQSIPTTSA
jgi:hypothetical protein